MHTPRYADTMDGNPKNANTLILKDGLMNLIPLSTPTASNVAGWREARKWLREMAIMGLNRIKSTMDGMTLGLPTKSKINTRTKSLIETAACTNSRIQEVHWIEDISLLSNPTQRAQVIRPGDTREDLHGRIIYRNKSKQLHAGTIHAYDAQTDKFSLLLQNGRTVEWELEQVCRMWGKGNDQQQ